VRILILMCAIAVGLSVSAAARQESFQVAEYQVIAGTRLDVELPVSAGLTDPATRIPVTIFHGAEPGPVLSITAGVHGYEFPPILAIQQLLTRIDPSTLRGTVVLVPVAHVAAFEERVPYVNPFDRKNLSRVFPGDPNGTQAQRIAWSLTTEVIRRADMHLDIHGGDAAEWLEPFVGVYGGSVAGPQYPRSREMGLALRFKNVVKTSINDRRSLESGRSVTRQAIADGKPAVVIESGENGRRDPAFVTPIEGSIDARAAVSGIFTPIAATGRPVRQGDALGIIQDYTGRPRETVYAPANGYVLYGLTGPPVRAGDSVANIGIPSKNPL
jgi:hypothetical protein